MSREFRTSPQLPSLNVGQASQSGTDDWGRLLMTNRESIIKEAHLTGSRSTPPADLQPDQSLVDSCGDAEIARSWPTSWRIPKAGKARPQTSCGRSVCRSRPKSGMRSGPQSANVALWSAPNGSSRPKLYSRTIRRQPWIVARCAGGPRPLAHSTSPEARTARPRIIAKQRAEHSACHVG